MKALQFCVIISNCLGEYLAYAGLKQLRVAESEKYAHVTFFFNGGIEKTFKNEDRIIIQSPKVPTYNFKPEMNAYLLTNKIIEQIRRNFMQKALDKFKILLYN